jgi:5-bromo-4-chloroindolyl phosphate hydrolysis protein
MVCGTLKECDQPKPLEFSAHQTVTPAFKDSGMTISLNWIVVVFFLVSAGFQITAATVSTNKFLLAPTVRFIEYSITAPLMTVGVALQSGIMHTHTLLMLATLSWTCMMVGLCSEKTWMAKSTMSEKLKAIKDEITIKEYAAERKQLDELRKIIYITQTVGWALFVITFYVVISAFQASQETCDSPEKAPKFIWAILYGQFLFSASFGVMQILEIVGAVSKDKADMGYIFLSFWSKTYLGWMIYGGNFVQA